MNGLLDYCKISGTSVKKYNGQRKYIATGDIEENRIINFENFTYEDKPSRANQNVEIGDVLFAKMQNTLKVIEITEDNNDFMYSTGFYVIKPGNQLHSKYLFWFFNSNYFNTQKDKLCVGATMKGLNNKGLSEIRINEIPTKEEQAKRIEKLENVKDAIENREQMLNYINEFIISKFRKCFDNYYDNKNKYKRLIDVCDFIDYRGKTPTKIENGVPLITAKNVRKDYFSFEPREYISQEEYDERMTRGIPEAGDVLFTTEGPLGNVCIIPDNIGQFAVGQRIITMKCNKSVRSKYLKCVLLSNEIQAEINKQSTGSTVAGIKSKLLKEIMIPIAPIELQDEFIYFYDTMENLKQRVENDITELYELKNTLMKKYFEE